MAQVLASKAEKLVSFVDPEAGWGPAWKTGYRPKLVAGEAGQQWRKKQYRHRYNIAQKNAELNRWHGLGRARYWGRLQRHGQAVLAALVSNAKRVVKLLRARGSWPCWPRDRNKRGSRSTPRPSQR